MAIASSSLFCVPDAYLIGAAYTEALSRYGRMSGTDSASSAPG